ncbi:hypothetical protein A3H03_02655 [Candidatus Kuenenbacteria bacterium RIFCSPLOWO2_12_FULL_42_13]|uniref:Uncharacterized protein n=1 Tax=Candidatus Kuenenbacteria bacterium RIFCSPLOWO2_12_FULL_42_13 TaxID=1798565 RepID=A0A1F6G0F0_9BACT|nr:MAG: hypothetical protein A3H03_02655 [Candidatus Kuenenbacteria bacterium RIFCSPLOWO2_12_FULL_42_13]
MKAVFFTSGQKFIHQINIVVVGFGKIKKTQALGFFYKGSRRQAAVRGDGVAVQVKIHKNKKSRNHMALRPKQKVKSAKYQIKLFPLAEGACLPPACRLPAGRQGRQGRQGEAGIALRAKNTKIQEQIILKLKI